MPFILLTYLVYLASSWLTAREHALALRGWAALSGHRNICLLGPPPLGVVEANHGGGGDGIASTNDAHGGNGVQRLPIFSFLIRFEAAANNSNSNTSSNTSSNNSSNISGTASSESSASSSSSAAAVVTGAGRFLHYQFVCALLNDLFGVQVRTLSPTVGCSETDR